MFFPPSTCPKRQIWPCECFWRHVDFRFLSFFLFFFLRSLIDLSRCLWCFWSKNRLKWVFKGENWHLVFPATSDCWILHKADNVSFTILFKENLGERRVKKLNKIKLGMGVQVGLEGPRAWASFFFPIYLAFFFFFFFFFF